MRVEIENRPGFHFEEVMSQIHIKVGDKIRVKTLSDKDTIVGSAVGTVIKVYPRFAVLDFGKYRESRLLIDIYFNTRGLYERL